MPYIDRPVLAHRWTPCRKIVYCKADGRDCLLMAGCCQPADWTRPIIFDVRAISNAIRNPNLMTHINDAIYRNSYRNKSSPLWYVTTTVLLSLKPLGCIRILRLKNRCRILNTLLSLILTITLRWSQIRTYWLKLEAAIQLTHNLSIKQT